MNPFSREFNIVPKKYRLDKPFALSIKGWKDWHKETKENHPVRYFLEETLDDWWRHFIYYPLNHFFYEKLWWGFQYRFNPKHQYHIVKPNTLKPGYCDPREMLLHSSFHILTEFVEYEKTDGHILWTNSWESTKTWYTMLQLHHWWTEIYPNREATMPDYPDSPKDAEFMWALDEDYDDTPEKAEWRRVSDIRNAAETKWEDENEEMLKKLAEIRLSLWN